MAPHVCRSPVSLLHEKEENNIEGNQRSRRLRAEGAGVGRPGELRGALGASWASPPLLGLLSGRGITSLGGGGELETGGLEGEARAPGSGGCPVTSWPCQCYSRAVA